MQLNADILLKKRAVIRAIKRVAVDSVGHVGTLLPIEAKLWAAKKSSKLGVLLKNDPAFIYDGYLGEYRIELSGRSGTDRALLSGKYEPEVMQVIKKIVKPGWNCIDIGANVGAITLALCKQIGREGKVFAFEPGPLFFNRLEKNIALNEGLETRVKRECLGLSDKEGELFWAEDPQFPGNAYLTGKTGTRVPVTTLDQYFYENPLKIDFIKIDVEGMELEVLKGAGELLKSHRPTILFETLMDFEVFRKAPIRKMAEAYLNELGYTLYSIDLNGNLLKTAYPHFGANTIALNIR